MEAKKNSSSDLEKFSKIFMLLGLVLALTVAYSAIEYSSKETTSVVDNDANSKRVVEEEIPETDQKMEEIKPQDLPPPPPVLEEIKVVEDTKKIVEKVIESTESNEKQKVVIREIKEVQVVEEVVEYVPFNIIEDVPVFPGCKGSKEQLKQCFSDKVQKLVNDKFNMDLANELGLAPGKQRINVQFKIDKTGVITDIQARAPHKRLEAEAVRVIDLLPQMIPGKQRGKAVAVKYTLPIVFLIQE